MDAVVQSSAQVSLCDRLKKLPTAVMSDVLATTGLPDQVLSASISVIAGGGTIAGPALCLLGREGPEPAAPPRGSKPVFEMDRHITSGCVAVIASGGHKTGALIGGNVGLSWRLRGCAGVVTDGGIRDAQEFAAMGLPVFASFLTPMSNKGRWAFIDIDLAVTLPGQTGTSVRVRSGDLVHADADGVVVVPAECAEQAVHDAEILDQAEARIRAALEKGEDREQAYARNDRFGHIKKIVT